MLMNSLSVRVTHTYTYTHTHTHLLISCKWRGAEQHWPCDTNSWIQVRKLPVKVFSDSILNWESWRRRAEGGALTSEAGECLNNIFMVWLSKCLSQFVVCREGNGERTQQFDSSVDWLTKWYTLKLRELNTRWIYLIKIKINILLRPFCLPQSFTEMISRLSVALWLFYFLFFSLLNLFLFQLSYFLSCFLMSLNIIFMRL